MLFPQQLMEVGGTQDGGNGGFSIIHGYWETWPNIYVTCCWCPQSFPACPIRMTQHPRPYLIIHLQLGQGTSMLATVIIVVVLGATQQSHSATPSVRHYYYYYYFSDVGIPVQQFMASLSTTKWSSGVSHYEKSIHHQSWGAYAGRHATTPNSHTLQVSTQAPFPYWITPSRRHQLATTVSCVGIPLASSMLGYSFWRRPNKQDRLPGSVPHAHITAVGVDGLCW